MLSSSPRLLIQAALQRHRRDPSARYLQMATVDSQGYPRNRTVVFRGWQGDTSTLLLATDARSRKVAELSMNPRVELCWYFAKTREQFRLRGDVRLADYQSRDPWRDHVWSQISEGGQVLWFWPEPGAAQAEPSAYVATIPRDPSSESSERPSVQPPDTFVLIRVHPQEVDHLQLQGGSGYPQLRHRYQWQGSQWIQETINP